MTGIHNISTYIGSAVGNHDVVHPQLTHGDKNIGVLIQNNNIIILRPTALTI